MRPVDLDEALFDELANQSGEDLVSVFIPTHRKGRDEIAQDRIRLKNQLARVEDYLEEIGWKPRERASRLAQARELLDDKEFWEHQLAGLALYIRTEDELTPVSVPIGIDPGWHVSQVFHLRHLVPGMDLARVSILVLTMKTVQLLEGTKLEIEESGKELPSFDEVNWFVDREVQRQQHPDRAGSTRSKHGHQPSARVDADRDRFLRAVAEAIPTDRADRLVVLGDDGLVERFQQISGLETISPENSGVSNPDSTASILDLARPAIEEIERSREAETLREALDRLGRGQASTSIEDAVPAAVAGRVGEVVLERNAEPIWGRLDSLSMVVETHDEPRHGDVDLVDRLVVESRKTGASIATVGESIEGDSFVASFRY